jgi:O-antigen/teichoic acid export membrane protein
MSLIDSLSKRFKVDADYIAKGSFWLVSGSVLGSVLSLVTSIIAARYIPKETFGIFKYIISMVGIAGAFALSGMNTVVTRSVSQGYEGSLVQSLKIQLRWSILQFLFLFALSIYYFAFANIIYGICFLIAAVAMPVSTAANTYNAFLSGKKDFKTSSLYGFLSTLIYTVAFAAIAVGLPYVLPIIIIYFVATTGANIFFCIRTIKKYKPNKSTQPGDESYALNLSFTNAFGIVAAHIDSVIVYHFLGTVQLAIYNFATIIPDKIRSLSGFIQTIALPKLAHHSSINRNNILRQTLLIFVFSIGLMGMYILLAPIAFNLFFPNYIESIVFSQIYSLTLIAALPAAYLMTVLSAYKLQKQLYILNICVPILKIVLLIAMIYYWGIMGAILARILSISVHLFAAGISIPKKTDIALTPEASATL